MERTQDLPRGLVTFLFTDIEGSTRLLSRLGGDHYAHVGDRHKQIVREVLASHNGIEIRTQGDSFFAVFSSASEGLAAAAEIQLRIAENPDPAVAGLRIRMGLHTGEAIPTAEGGEGYVGLEVHRGARIGAVAYGCQVLVSDDTKRFAEDEKPGVFKFKDLGVHRLKDLAEKQQLFQLVGDGLESEFPPLLTLDAIPTNLPNPTTSLVGREGEVSELENLLAEGAARLITLTGTPGVGKSRLAREAAGRSLVRFKHGVFFLDLAPIEDLVGLESAICRILGVHSAAGESLRDALFYALRDRQLLLVLDNIEHLDDTAALVGEMLRLCPKVTVLATSRLPLHLIAEHEFPVASLAVPPADENRSLQIGQAQAVMFFIQQAHVLKPEFELSDDSARVVAAICRQLDGLALAEQLAAFRLVDLDPKELLKRLTGNPLDVLVSDRIEEGERHQTMAKAIDWSYRLLSEDEQHFLARMSVFEDGATIEVAEAICNSDGRFDTFEVIEALVDSNLIVQGEQANGEPLFSLPGLIRAFAARKLDEFDERDETERRRSEYFMVS